MYNLGSEISERDLSKNDLSQGDLSTSDLTQTGEPITKNEVQTQIESVDVREKVTEVAKRIHELTLKIREKQRSGESKMKVLSMQTQLIRQGVENPQKMEGLPENILDRDYNPEKIQSLLEEFNSINEEIQQMSAEIAALQKEYADLLKKVGKVESLDPVNKNDLTI